MLGKLHGNLFSQECYLLNELSIKIQLIRSKDSFCLMGAPNNAKLQVVRAALFVRKDKLSLLVFLAHAESLQNATAKYPIKCCVCKTFMIPQNYSNMTYEKIIPSQLLLKNAAFCGSRSQNLQLPLFRTLRDRYLSGWAAESDGEASRVAAGVLNGHPFGGFITVVKNDRQSQLKTVHGNDRFVIVKLANYLLINVYLPCVDTKDRLFICENIFENLWSWLEHYPNCECVIAGD